MQSIARTVRLPSAAIESLDRIIDLELPVIIGDATGVDSLVQRYLATIKKLRFTLLLGKEMANPETLMGILLYQFVSYADRDEQMCSDRTYGLAIWAQQRNRNQYQASSQN